MSSSASARRLRSRLLAGVVVVSALVAVLVHQSLASSSWSAASPAFPPGDRAAAIPRVGSDRAAPGDSGRRDRDGPAAVGEEDGVVAESVTVFDHDAPAVTKLDPALLDALRRAARSAAGRGIDILVTSGWRSPEYQEQLLREAVEKHGSAREAARWVATPETSAHVSGDAVDIEHADAIAWLSAHGAEYGLCQIYRNEPWHFELRPKARDQGCPPMYADPRHDPRMQP